MSDSNASLHDAYLGRKYFPELDGLRGLSVLLVLSWHMYDTHHWAWLAGFRGVTLFFVLSGFLITTLALREEDRRGRLSLAAFYVRRCCRILPLYYLTLAVYGLLIGGAGFLPEQAKLLGAATPYYLLYLQEWPYCRWELLAQQHLAFSHGWTLGVEEKFYLFWPLLTFVWWRGAARPRLRGAAALAVGFALLPLALAPLGPEAQAAGRMAFGYGSLLAGCVLAVVLHSPDGFARLRRLGRAGWTTAVLAALLAAHFATPWVKQAPWADLLNVWYIAAVTAFLGCLLCGAGLLQRLLRWRPLALVGRLSYGIYLVHILCLGAVCKVMRPSEAGWGGTVLTYASTCLLSIAVAWVLHVAVESPCIELGRRWSRRILEGSPKGRAPALTGASIPGA